MSRASARSTERIRARGADLEVLEHPEEVFLVDARMVRPGSTGLTCGSSWALAQVLCISSGGAIIHCDPSGAVGKLAVPVSCEAAPAVGGGGIGDARSVDDTKIVAVKGDAPAARGVVQRPTRSG